MMEVLKEAHPITLEPTENGIIVRVASARDPYSDMGRIATTYVFNDINDLTSFISKHFLGEVKSNEKYTYEGNSIDSIYAIDGNPVFGGGS